MKKQDHNQGRLGFQSKIKKYSKSSKYFTFEMREIEHITTTKKHTTNTTHIYIII